MHILKSTLRLAPVVLAVSLLAGCGGYRPLYGSNAAESGVKTELSGISVAEQRNRAGQLVRNELTSVMRGTGSSGYVLELLPEEQTRKISAQVGQKLERYRYALKVSYVLHRTESKEPLTEGTVFSNVGYDTVEQPVSDLQAAENARARATKEVAEDIRLRLAAYFAGG
jgi:LPS-assembly lipoprotein